jgi:tRNA C32,U32 (ribose-2'-O)-methylase TrmJ
MVLVSPPRMTVEATARASHAKDILEAAEVMTLDEVFARSDLVVATTGGLSKSVSNPVRMPYYSRQNYGK